MAECVVHSSVVNSPNFGSLVIGKCNRKTLEEKTKEGENVKEEKKISISTMVWIILLAVSICGNLVLLYQLGSQASRVSSTIESLTSRIRELEATGLGGRAHLISSGNDFTFKGFVCNFGTEDAYDVSVTVYLYGNESEVYSETKIIGDIKGRDYAEFETSFTFTDTWDDWDWCID